MKITKQKNRRVNPELTGFTREIRLTRETWDMYHQSLITK